MMPYRLSQALIACTLMMLSIPSLGQTSQGNSASPQHGAVPKQTQAERDDQEALLAPYYVINAITPLQLDQKRKIEANSKQTLQEIKAANRDRAKITEIYMSAVAAVRTILTPVQIKQLQHCMPAVILLKRTHTIPAEALEKVNLTEQQWKQIVTIQAAVYAKPFTNREEEKADVEAFHSIVLAILTEKQKEVVAQSWVRSDAAKTARPAAPNTGQDNGAPPKP